MKYTELNALFNAYITAFKNVYLFIKTTQNCVHLTFNYYLILNLNYYLIFNPEKYCMCHMCLLL